MNRIIKVIVYLMILFLFTSCSSPGPEKHYKKVAAIGGLGYFRETPKKALPPIDLTKEKMTVEAYNKISLGISIFVVAFVISICFKNSITHKIADIGMAGGGVWCMIGMVKLFVATYLFWFCVAAFLVVVFALVYRLKGRSILNAKKWFKNKRKHRS